MPADEERDGERRGDRAEGDRVGRPADDEHEDQPDVVGLPDRAHRVVGVLAQRPVALAAAAEQLPEAGAEVGAAEHRVGGQAEADQDRRADLSEHRSATARGRATLHRRAREAAQQPGDGDGERRVDDASVA